MEQLNFTIRVEKYFKLLITEVEPICLQQRMTDQIYKKKVKLQI